MGYSPQAVNHVSVIFPAFTLTVKAGEYDEAFRELLREKDREDFFPGLSLEHGSLVMTSFNKTDQYVIFTVKARDIEEAAFEIDGALVWSGEGYVVVSLNRKNLLELMEGNVDARTHE